MTRCLDIQEKCKPLLEADSRIFKPNIGGHPVYATSNNKGYSTLVMYVHGAEACVLEFKRNREISYSNIEFFTSMGHGFIESIKKEFKHLLKKHHKRVPLTELPALFIKIKQSVGALYHWLPQLSQNTDSKGVKVGPFEVRGPVSEEQMKAIKTVVKDVVRIVTKQGYKHLLYGVITVSKERHTSGFYVEKGDMINFAPKALLDTKRATQTLIHELGHRQWYKFKTDTDQITKDFLKLKRSRTALVKEGDRLLNNFKYSSCKGNVAIVLKASKKLVDLFLIKDKDVKDFDVNAFLNDGTIYKVKDNAFKEDGFTHFNGAEFKIRKYTRWGIEAEFINLENSSTKYHTFNPDSFQEQTTAQNGKPHSIPNFFIYDNEDMSTVLDTYTLLDGTPIVVGNGSLRMSDYAMTKVEEFFAELMGYGLANNYDHVIKYLKKYARK